MFCSIKALIIHKPIGCQMAKWGLLDLSLLFRFYIFHATDVLDKILYF